MNTLQTILIPTDFSEAARNAIEFAIHLTKKSNAKLILFHVYQYPVLPPETGVMIPIQDFEADSKMALGRLKEEIHKNHGNDISIEIACSCGFPIDEINEFSNQCKADLVVMGISGTGFISEKIMGSTTTSLIQKSVCPVLVIGKRSQFKEINKIVLANDLHHLKNNVTVQPLREISLLFNAHVYVLNVERSETPDTEKDKMDTIHSLDMHLKGIDHSFHMVKNNDVVEGLRIFINEKNIDLAVIITRKHSIWENIIHEPNTKRMAFHSEIPLLALHE